MKAKKLVSVLIMIMAVLSVEIVFTEGLLPSIEDVYGVDMPSIAYVMKREPDQEITQEDGSIQQIYNGVTENDVDAFSEYLEQWDCTLDDYSVDGSVMIVTINRQGKTFTLIYGNTTQTAVLTYPKGTRCESWEEIMAVAAAAREAKLKPFQTVGSTVTFGSYEQDNKKWNGSEPIVWMVLDVQENRALLISKYGLDAKPYETQARDITWELCTLRIWLNCEFLNVAFSTAEQDAILMTTVDNNKASGHGGYSTTGGNNTQDKVFLLSYEEAWKYFRTDEALQCTPTNYAAAQGAYQNSENRNCNWWLRSLSSGSLRYVDNNGLQVASNVVHGSKTVRPALWVDLESDYFVK